MTWEHFFLLFVSSVNLGSFLYGDISFSLSLPDMFTTAFSSPPWNQGCWWRYGFSSGLEKLLIYINKSLHICLPCVLVPFHSALTASWVCAALKSYVLTFPNLSSIFSSCFAALCICSFAAHSTHHEAISCPSKCLPSPTFLQFSWVCWTEGSTLGWGQQPCLALLHQIWLEMCNAGWVSAISGHPTEGNRNKQGGAPCSAIPFIQEDPCVQARSKRLRACTRWSHSSCQGIDPHSSPTYALGT